MPDLTGLLGLDPQPLGEPTTTADASAAFKDIDGVLATGASNNWVVSGERTQSGLPIVANDPHLGLMAPSIWYLAHLEVTGEFDEPRRLIGVSLPGTPFVLLGRGNDIAWGFTNTAADAQDVFVERVNPENPDEYLTPTGWELFGQKEEIIRVKGGQDHASRGAGPVMVRCFLRPTSILTGCCLRIPLRPCNGWRWRMTTPLPWSGHGFTACARSRISRTGSMPS
jgi:penicillin amidase